MADTIAKVPGITNASGPALLELVALAKRHAWDVDAIASVISRESGFRADAKNPFGSATGLLQFTRETLRGLGFSGTRDEFAALSDVDQMAFVERYFARAFGATAPSRPVDYYLATWGAQRGLPLDHVLATQGEKVYEINKGLDLNNDGTIRVSDLDQALRAQLARAGGQRIDPKAFPGEVRMPLPGASLSPLGLVSLPVLRAGSVGAAVEHWRALVELWLQLDAPARARARVLDTELRNQHDAEAARKAQAFDPILTVTTEEFQREYRLKVDGVVGMLETWPAMSAYLRALALHGKR